MDQSLAFSLEDTFVHTAGSGETVLIFHGGPGFDHSYLVPHLSFLSANHKLVFFDQYGAGKTVRPADTLTFRSICTHAAEVISHFQENHSIRVIAHSFGAAVLLGALSVLPQTKPSGLILNAVPTNKDRFDAMRGALFAKMGPEVAMSLADPSLTVLAPEQLAALLPFYISPNSQPDLNGLSFDFSQYNRVYQSLETYDVSASVARLSQCDLILGDDDFINVDLINDVSRHCRSVKSLASAGHFTFAEQPEEFRLLATQALG